jgi:basic membrane protein A and related proteins
MRKTTFRALGFGLAAALVLSACGEANNNGDGGGDGDGEATDLRGCQVTDTGGIDDRSFNETAWAGFQRAEAELGAEISFLESQSESDYEPHINTFIDQDCDLIVTVGFLLGDATEEAALANTDNNFAIIDYAYEEEYPNLQAMVFATEEAGFLAGYVAAAMTETGAIGTWGGVQIPPVTSFMDGYLAGARYYNQENGTDVEVLGWDGDSGVFTNDFEAQDLGANVTADLLQNGADIIMPVAGPAGLGTATAIDNFGSGLMIWVDTDGYESTNFGEIILTSVEKKMDNAVFDAMQAIADGDFAGGTYVGTLENDGVGLAPFHDFEDQVPDEVKSAIDEIREGIIAGEISVSPADYS